MSMERLLCGNLLTFCPGVGSVQDLPPHNLNKYECAQLPVIRFTARICRRILDVMLIVIIMHEIQFKRLPNELKYNLLSQVSVIFAKKSIQPEEDMKNVQDFIELSE